MSRFAENFMAGLIILLFQIHITGMTISGVVFSYIYIRDSGFANYAAFGFIQPALKAIIWEFYLAEAITTDKEAGKIKNSERDELFKLIGDSSLSMAFSDPEYSENDTAYTVTFFKWEKGGIAAKVSPDVNYMSELQADRYELASVFMFCIIVDENIDGTADFLHIPISDSSYYFDRNSEEDKIFVTWYRGVTQDFIDYYLHN